MIRHGEVSLEKEKHARREGSQPHYHHHHVPKERQLRRLARLLETGGRAAEKKGLARQKQHGRGKQQEEAEEGQAGHGWLIGRRNLDEASAAGRGWAMSLGGCA